MLAFVWDEWPEFFRGRLRVLYELTEEVRSRPAGGRMSSARLKSRRRSRWLQHLVVASVLRPLQLPRLLAFEDELVPLPGSLITAIGTASRALTR
jgi:hypothetical protein